MVGELNPRLLVVALGGKADLAQWGEQIRGALGPDVVLSAIKPNIFDDMNPRVKGVFLDSTNGYINQPSWARTQKFATYLPEPLIEKVKLLKPGRAVSRALTRINSLQEKGGWKKIERIPFVPQALDDAITSLSIDPQNPIVFCVLGIEVDKESGGSPPLANRWMEVLGTPTIPFAANARRQLEIRAGPQLKNLFDLKRTLRKASKMTKQIGENQ